MAAVLDANGKVVISYGYTRVATVINNSTDLFIALLFIYLLSGSLNFIAGGLSSGDLDGNPALFGSICKITVLIAYLFTFIFS